MSQLLKLIFFVALWLATAASASPATLGWNSLGVASAGCDGNVAAMARLANGDVILGGSFQSCGFIQARRVIRYSAATRTYVPLGPASANGVDGPVSAIAIIGEDIYVAGDFLQAGALTARRIAKFNAASGWSQVGPAANPGISGTVNAMVAMNNKIYVGGSFSLAGLTSNVSNLAMWDGVTWQRLGSGVDRDVRALAVQGSNLIVGGEFGNAGTLPVNQVVLWNGTNYLALGTGVNGVAYGLSADASNIFVTGAFSTAGGISANNVARWNGVSWQALIGGASNGLANEGKIIAQLNNELYVGDATGNFWLWDGANWTRVGFGVGLNQIFASVLVYNDELWVGGQFGYINDRYFPYFMRYLPSNRQWTPLIAGTTGNGVNGPIYAATWRNGLLYVGGNFSQTGSETAFNIAVWNGSQWSALGTAGQNGTDGTVRALRIVGNDLYLGGDFRRAGGVSSNFVARWNGSSFQPLGTGANNGTDGPVLAITDFNNEIYLGGSFLQAGGAGHNRISKWTGSGFLPLGTGVNNTVRALTSFRSRLIIGGDFTQAGSSGASYIAAWNGTAFLALATGTGASVLGKVTSFAVGGSELFVGGDLDGFQSGALGNVARWNESSFRGLVNMDGSFPANVRTVLLSGDSIYAGTEANDGNVSRWNSGAWQELAGGVCCADRSNVYALASQETIGAAAAADVYVGGDYYALDLGNGTGLNAFNLGYWSPSPDPGNFRDGFE